MPDVHFEIIGLDDIGKDVLKVSSSSSTTTKSSNRGSYKLTEADVENLKHYLNRYNQPISKETTVEKAIQQISSPDLSKLSAPASSHRHQRQDYVDITDDFYSEKFYTELKKPSEHSQPLVDIYRYHHHYRRHHQHARQAHEKPTTSTVSREGPGFSLEFSTCGMKKNTRLPVPHENFSLAKGCFGDDAGFTLRHKQKTFFGISDGAGGNLMYGFDPRLFSESLMRNCSTLAGSGKYSTHDPKRLLCHAFDRVQTENCYGSATACVLGMNCETGQLHSVNIGDSGYVIIRKGRVVYRSRSQKMNGDCPRQLDVYPWTASLKRKGLNYTQISSLDAICQNFQLELGDTIILSTDGLFDNVPDRLMERVVTKAQSLKHATNYLVNHAVRYYVKPDDILVIMARVVAAANDTA